MPQRSLSRPVWLLAVLAIAFASACGTSEDLSDGPLTIGVLPDEAPDRLTEKYASLVDRLESALGQEVELIIPTDYADLVDRFSSGDIDVGYFGGLTYLLARDRAGAEPLVMRDVDARFTSVFVARSADGRSTIDDFSGASLGFGSELSTSGHLMPRHHFGLEFGMAPEDHFGAVSFSGAHDRTLEWLLEGKVDVAALSTPAFRQLTSDGSIDGDSVRVLYETPIYVDYVFAGSPDLPEEAATTVMETLLDLSVTEASDRAILEDLGATRFLHAFPRLWGALEDVSHEMGLIDGG